MTTTMTDYDSSMGDIIDALNVVIVQPSWVSRVADHLEDLFLDAESIDELTNTTLQRTMGILTHNQQHERCEVRMKAVKLLNHELSQRRNLNQHINETDGGVK